MNRIFRIIFNRNTGRLEVVSELAKSPSLGGSVAGKHDAQAVLSDVTSRLVPRGLSAWLMLALGTATLALPAIAQQAPLPPATVTTPPPTQIVADPNAPKNQQPTILPTASGSVQVNIQTPTKAGVSMNQYRQFDVGANGAVLNNSRTNVQTQTAGWIQGNPWLATGTARIIVNQVNSTDPSKLAGNLEVAGDRAEVIFANGAGIQVDGAGFINASKVTLTSGLPQLGSTGALESYRVTQGNIAIAGGGLNTGDADYTQLLARSVQVNANIWSNHLKVVTGSNQVSAVDDGATPTAIAASGAAPTVALDVGQLGGMYAGKITLIGTEAGLGIRNAGTLAAQSGGITIDANGMLSNSGTVAVNGAANALNIHASDLDNAGTLSSQGNVLLNISNATSNSGLTVAGREVQLQTATLNNSGSVNAQRLDLTTNSLTNSGTLQQTGAQGLDITAGSVTNRNAAHIGATPLTAGSGDSGSGNPSTNPSTPPSSSESGGSTAAQTPAPESFATGTLRVRDALNNDGGTIAANGDVTLSSQGSVSNTGKSTIDVTQLRIASGTLDNGGGTLNTDTAQLNVEALRNNAGTFATQSPLTLNAQTLENRGGTLSVNGAFTANVNATLDNQFGVIVSRDGLLINASAADNTQGTVTSNTGDVTLNLSGALNNAGGTVQTTKQLNVQANGVNNDGGTLLGDTLQLQAGTAASSNRGGKIAANTTTIASGALENDAGLIQGVNALHIDTHGQTLLNTNSGANGGLHSDGDITLSTGDLDSGAGVIAAGAALNITSDNLTNDKGLIASGAALNLNSSTLSNVDGTVQSNGTATLNVAGDVNNASGVILAKDAFALTAHALNNNDGVIGSLDAATTLALSAGMQNRGGTVVSGADLQLASNGFDNAQGTLIAKHLGIDAGSGTLINTQGTLAGDTVTLRSGALDNRDGLIQAQTQLTVDASGTLSNAQSTDGGGIRSGADASITASAFENGNGDVIAMGALNLSIANQLRNDGGLIAAMNGVQLRSGSLDNAGTIQSATTLNASVTGTLSNRGSMLATDTVTITADTISNDGGILASTDSDVVLTAKSVSNAGGLIAAKTNLSASIDGALNNDSGTLQAGDAMSLTSRSLSNASGVIQSANQLTIDTQGGVFGNAGGTVSSNAVAVRSGALNNDGGLLQSATTLNIHTGSAELINSHSGSENGLRAGGALTVTAGNLNNTQGFVASGDTVALDLSGALTNTNGTVLSANAMTVNAGSVTNANGVVAAIDGDLAVTTQGLLNNAQGQLQSNRNVVLTSSGLDNAGGMIAGEVTTVNTRGQALNNAQGTVAGTTVNVDAGALDNTGGLLHASQSLTVNTNGSPLLNRDSGTRGGIISGGTLDVTAGALENQRGVIASASDTSLSTTSLTNSQGLVSTQGDLNLSAQSLSNGDGAILIGGKGDVRITHALDNSNGLLQGAGTLDVNANTLINANTKSGDPAIALGIAANTLNLTATTIDNAGGILVADTDLTIRGTGVFDNTGGDVIGGRSVAIMDPTYTRTVSNTDGQILAGHSVAIQARTVQGQGTIASALNLSLDLADSIDNRSDMSAAGDLTVKTQGDLNNRAKIIGKNVTVSAANIDNEASGEIAATDGITDVAASGTLTNRGLIDGVLTHVSAGTLNNLGTGRIYGDALAIGATTLNNVDETVNGVTKAGTIAARGNLQIGANAITNRNGALIYSDGDAAIGGALDGNQLATGSAATLENRSATIDIAGNLSIAADQIHNVRDGVSISQVQSVDETVTMQLASWQQNGSNSGPLKQTSNYRAWQVMYLDPSQILESSTVVTPDGYQMGRAVVKLTANTSMFYGAFGGMNSSRNERSRLIPSDGTVTVYYRLREDGQSNPDQVSGGDVPFAAMGMNEPGATSYESNTITYSSSYGTCTTNCVQLLGAYLYSDPYTIIENRIQGSDHFNTEEKRIAHHTAVDDVAAPDMGIDAVIRSGGDMLLTTSNLRNEYGRIAAGGNLVIRDQSGNTAGIVSNIGASLYRTHSFSNTSIGYGGGSTNWTRPQLSELIGEVGGSITAGGTLVINTGTLENFNDGRDAPNILAPSAFVKQALGTAPTFTATGTDTLAGQIHGSDVQNADDAPQAIAPTATLTPLIPGTLAPVTSTTTETITPSGFTILTTPSTGNVAASSLFSVNPNASAFFIETDPRFTNYRTWLSSEWMINALGIDPGNIHKRLGDGYYEQKLIRDQIGQLTGRRFLDGYANDEEQYKALMSAGVTFAKDYGLRPGIALTAEQMARLTSDIVWLVEEDVTLPDGTKVRALVPKVYVAVRNGDINPNGALLAADRIHLNLSGDATNTGDIAGRKVVAINAGTISNLRGANISANTVLMDAQKDIRNIGSTIRASDAISLNALGSIDIRSTTATQSGSGPYSWSQTTIDRTAGLYVTNPSGLGIIAMNAGKDIHLVGATIRNAGSNGITQLNAGGSVNLGTVDTASSQRYEWNQDNFRANAQTSQVGTTIATANHLQINAGSDINATAATLSSDHGQIALNAGHDINLLEGRNTTDVSGSQTSQKSGLLSTTKTKTTWDSHSDTANGTTVSGDSVVLNAGNDLTTRGANVVATNDVLLKAGNNIDIGAAKNTSHSFESTQTKSSGVFSDGGTGFTVGSKKQSSTVTTDAVTHTGSTIGSTDGSVTIVAGKDVTITGSDILSNTGTAISGQNVTVQGATDTLEVTQTSKTSSSGLHVSVRGGAADVANSLIGSAQGAANASDPRLKALHAAQAAQTLLSNDKAGLKSLKEAAKGNTLDENGNGMSLRVGVGASSSSSTTTHNESTNVASNIHSNGDVTITARGDANGQGGDLTVQGSNVAANNVTLAANRDLILKSATDTSSDIAKNTAKSGEIGFTVGSEAGYGIYVSASGAKGSGTGSSTTHQETQINAASTVTLSSGRDTTLEGAQVRGDTVLANVGNNLTVTSQQDTDQYRRKDTSAGIDAVAGSGGWNVSANANQSRINSDYKSVNEQSGIAAGSGGFSVNVGNHTQLNGGAIVSTADASKNTLSTQTLASTDLTNQSSFNASSVGFSAGIGKGGAGGLSPSLGVPQSGADSSTTKSAISDGTVNIGSGDAAALAGINRDQTELQMQGLANTFDEQKIREAMALGQVGGQVGMTAVGDVSVWMQQRAKEDYRNALKNNDTVGMSNADAAFKAWSDGGMAKTLLHGLVGAGIAALGGGDAVSGAIGAATSEVIKPALATFLNSQGIDPRSGLYQSLMNIGSTVVGGLVGQGSGAATALSGDKSNRQLHPDELQWIRDNATEFAKQLCGCNDPSNELVTQARVRLTAQAAQWVDRTTAELSKDSQLTVGGAYFDDPAANYLIDNMQSARFSWGQGFVATNEQYNDKNYNLDLLMRNGGENFHFVVNSLIFTGAVPLSAQRASNIEAFYKYANAVRHDVGTNILFNFTGDIGFVGGIAYKSATGNYTGAGADIALAGLGTALPWGIGKTGRWVLSASHGGIMTEPALILKNGATSVIDITKNGVFPLRAAYEFEVRNIESVINQMQKSGATDEAIARTVNRMRRDIGVKYKNATPPAMLEDIYARNLERYGDMLGPSYEQLRSIERKTDKQIIESAVRPGGSDIDFRNDLWKWFDIGRKPQPKKPNGP